ncbi:sensor domain-containing diguanylate cyclase [Motiliproteus sp. MSK22-1]|uniref:sensor domain-containing diguanylate cyclase n=1 Tax=Motiliproteus sp. MSK22-1 TaxID=1897630 RepID=UPI000975F40F|nr:sensor domain-containing diguanylate cyclase [Motiliproteus sp. MSK22-1]OMH32099.1 hypothetical protein BGP75_15460 [Motiliproteus sp. MSK22-1]
MQSQKLRQAILERLSQRTLLLGILLSLAVLVSSALYLYEKRQSILAEEIQNANRFNSLLLEQTARIYDSVDLLLRATVTKLEDGRFLANNTERGLYELLNSYITGMPHIKALSVLDSTGNPLATTFRYPTSRPNFSERGYFRTLKNDPSLGMYIDVPVRRRSNENQWLLNVARRLPAHDGSFGGVVVVSLVPEYFSSFYDSLKLEEGSYVSLLREDSTLLMRHPAKDESIGKVFGRNPAIQPFLKQRLPQTSLRMYSHISKTNVLVNCRFAKIHPIYVCASTMENSLLGDWKRDLISIGAISSLICVIIMTLFILLSKQLQSREAMAAELVQKNRDLDLLSKTDHLTGIANRNFIETRIKELISNSKRYERPFSVILIDIDHFKSINDTYGHSVGDRVLIEFSNTLSKRIRDTDLAGRWGGEEFLIICNESDSNGATQLAEELRSVIENNNFGLQAPVTSSFGVSQYRQNERSEELFRRVDELLYTAKDSGRNRVVSG